MPVMLSAMPRQRPFEKRERSAGGGRSTAELVEAVEDSLSRHRFENLMCRVKMFLIGLLPITLPDAIDN